jgi:hypothetical protein
MLPQHVFSNQREIFKNFAERVALLAAIYFWVNLIYQHSYLASLGFEFGFFSIVASLPIVSNFLVAGWAFIIWGFVSEIQNSSYQQFIGLFNLSTWRQKNVLILRMSVVLFIIGYYVLAQLVYLGVGEKRLGAPLYAALTIIALIITVFFITGLVESLRKKCVFHRLRIIPTNNLRFETVTKLSLLVLLSAFFVLSVRLLVRIMTPIDYGDAVSVVVEDYAWVFMWPSQDFLSSTISLLIFLIPVGLMAVSILVYRSLRKKGLYQLLPRRKNRMIQLINFVYPALFFQIFFFCIIVAPTWYGRAISNTNLESMVQRDEQRVIFLSLKSSLPCNLSVNGNRDTGWFYRSDNKGLELYYQGKFHNQELFTIVRKEGSPACNSASCVDTCVLNESDLSTMKLTTNNIARDYFSSENLRGNR